LVAAAPRCAAVIALATTTALDLSRGSLPEGHPIVHWPKTTTYVVDIVHLGLPACPYF
jgi:hypothetical protein